MEVYVGEVDVEVGDDAEDARAEETAEDEFERIVAEELDFEAVFDAEFY